MKKLILLQAFVSALFIATATNLPAQLVLSGSGGIDINGGSAFTPASQSGTASRFLWLPGKGALLFGSFSATPLLSDIGTGSIAGGANATAPGDDSLAFGSSSYAFGASSIAIGVGSSASGYYGSAFGYGSESDGMESIALGGAVAAGDGSVAIGPGASAYQENGIAIGVFCYADATNGIAIGLNSYTSSVGGIALGVLNNNLKKDGLSMPSSTASPDDPIFEIGIGESGINKNAFTIYRDGTVRMIKAAGGISMGGFL